MVHAGFSVDAQEHLFSVRGERAALSLEEATLNDKKAGD